MWFYGRKEKEAQIVFFSTFAANGAFLVLDMVTPLLKNTATAYIF